MAVYTPPTETLPIFDNSVFPSASGTALTIATGLDYFLSYPVAQGSEIFPSNITLQSTLTDSSGDVGTLGQVLTSTGTGTNWTNAGGITGNLDLPPPYGLLTDTITQSASHVSGTNINLYGTSTDSDILIGSTLPAPQTVRICNTTSGSSGGSVHCANIGIDGANINNATTPAAGTIKIGNSLTTGPLYIGCGSTTAAHTTGPILIGSDSTATGGISIGTNSTTLPLTTNAINIGSGTYTTNILGTSTMSGFLTATAGIITTSLNTPLSSSVLSIGELLTHGGSAAITPLLIGINIDATPTTGIQIGGLLTNIKLEGATTATLGLTASNGNITASNGNIIGQTVRNGLNTGSISQAGVLTGTSVIAPSYNASSNATDVGICTNQTSGFLNIGTGVRTTTGTINIGTGAGANVNPINIGGAGSTTTVNGLIANNGLTMGNGYGITCGTTTYTPTSSQIGYTPTKTTNASGVSLPNSTATAVLTVSGIPIGNYIIVFAVTINNTSIATTYSSVSTSTTNATLIMPMSDIPPTGGTTSTQHTGASYTGFLNVTASTGSVVFSINPRGSSASVGSGDAQATYMRIG